ncbi:hypothetical protein PT015_15955 [Candidatus Mycobacterium wuenschmannii]|uniref:Secreted protein n=1 Tax=Candidatus Mycobacterium wuenschmannii TaxID=3027808 RepID=A0ABY8VXY1_9MYCO|nr:hypothetical protein [Candidatus Mycobacterium wuenschmannii]WIM86394.1 hypothetical protein PT015_15955 [Candidatus Mycobacterium wuenschmannii]
MRPAVRYGITAGVAIGGISVLIAAPSSPPLRDVEVPAMQLSNNSHDNPDANGPSFADLLQTMGGVETPVVVQNITEYDGVLEGGQPADIPGLSDLLNLGNDPAGANDPQGKNFIEIGPLLPSDLTLTPPAGR